jgi:uncharacterized membrane-anchored protein
MEIKGIARVDKRTKDLVKRLNPYEIAVIHHSELDEVAAESLVAARVKAVINAVPSLSNQYPNPGPLVLVKAGIVLLDNVGEDIMVLIKEGEEIKIVGEVIYKDKHQIAGGHLLNALEIKAHMTQVQQNVKKVLPLFVENTLEYAKQEIGLLVGSYATPNIKTSFTKKHALVVVRGKNYKEDLQAVKSYIDEVKPILIGVDGGADALREHGYRPDVIIGDMDSVSDDALREAADLIVHAYPNGHAPGLVRVEQLGLSAEIFAAPGTSEDVALLLAYEKGAELIVAVGTHSSMEDFLEKGRKGMASTFLVRLKIGSIFVDAKGVSKLYRNRLKISYLAQIILAALLPAGAILLISPTTRELLRLLYIHFRLILGI